MEFSMLINMKMPTIVGIFVFISRENFMLSWVEHEKSFITSESEISWYYKTHLQVFHKFSFSEFLFNDMSTPVDNLMCLNEVGPKL